MSDKELTVKRQSEDVQQSTHPKVFIIESLSFEDEDFNLFEGRVISDILELSEIETKYYYIRTKKEFVEVLEKFNESNYRYLHISCHGGKNKDSIRLTCEHISFAELGELLEFKLERKRLFLSACSETNENLARELIPKTDCISTIGPRNDTKFKNAAILWSCFYHLMFKKDSGKMVRKNVIENMQRVVDMFDEPLNFFAGSRSRIMTSEVIKPNKHKPQKIR